MIHKQLFVNEHTRIIISDPTRRKPEWSRFLFVEELLTKLTLLLSRKFNWKITGFKFDDPLFSQNDANFLKREIALLAKQNDYQRIQSKLNLLTDFFFIEVNEIIFETPTKQRIKLNATGQVDLDKETDSNPIILMATYLWNNDLNLENLY